MSTIYYASSILGVKLFKLADKDLLNYPTIYEEVYKFRNDPYKLKNIYLSPE